MSQKYEYRFVRLGEGLLGVRRGARNHYQQVVHEHARDGWRLVQIFAPGTGGYGAAKYFELISSGLGSPRSSSSERSRNRQVQ